MKPLTFSIMDTVNELPCGRVANILSYIFHARYKVVRFGNGFTNIADLCNKWPDMPCRAIQIVVYAGPPGLRGMYRLSVAQLVRDYVMTAYIEKNHNAFKQFMECITDEN